MERTSSWSWPNLFNVSQNKINIAEGNVSIVNRTRLLILTEPTELYGSPTFGVGLKRYLWQYNTKNIKAIIQDRVKDQLREHEPYVDPDETVFADGLLFTGQDSPETNFNDANELKMTIGLQTIYHDKLDLSIALEQNKLYTALED